MANKSIVDRVLLAAAAVCTAGLVWQLTVLVTSKGHGSVARAVAAQTAAPAGNPSAADAVAKPEPTPVRVVYPGADTPRVADAAKNSVKASDAPAPAIAAAPTLDASPIALVTPAEAAPSSALPAPSHAPTAGATPAASSPTVTAASAPPTVVAMADPAPAASAAKGDAATSDDTASDDATDGGRSVNINKASAAALNRLHGGGHIGQAIISHRPYKSVDDLIKKRVLRREVVEKIRDQIAAE